MQFVAACFADGGDDFFKNPILKLDRFGFVAAEDDAVEVGLVDEGELPILAARPEVHFMYPSFLEIEAGSLTVFNFQNFSHVFQAEPRLAVNGFNADRFFRLESEDGEIRYDWLL